MLFLSEIVFWSIGFALLHIGIFRRIQGSKDRRTVLSIATGIVILVLGATMWLLSAGSLERLSETLQVAPEKLREKEEILTIQPDKRYEVSLELAKIAFASGADNVKVIDTTGNWIPFEPSLQDVNGRDKQLKMLSEINLQRQSVLAAAVEARQAFERWIISLFMAIVMGVISGLLFGDFKNRQKLGKSEPDSD